MVLSDISLAEEGCKGGLCRVSLDSLDNPKISKKVKVNPSVSEENKNKEIKEKTLIKLSVK
jgi:hypothetical protein